jgi:osmoprotectant transport system ATP-binding protein
VGDAVEEGAAEGEAVAADASQRDALAELLWSGRTAVPVDAADGRRLGRVTVEGLVRRAARPA